MDFCDAWTLIWNIITTYFTHKSVHSIVLWRTVICRLNRQQTTIWLIITFHSIFPNLSWKSLQKTVGSFLKVSLAMTSKQWHITIKENTFFYFGTKSLPTLISKQNFCDVKVDRNRNRESKDISTRKFRHTKKTTFKNSSNKQQFIIKNYNLLQPTSFENMPISQLKRVGSIIFNRQADSMLK